MQRNEVTKSNHAHACLLTSVVCCYAFLTHKCSVSSQTIARTRYVLYV